MKPAIPSGFRPVRHHLKARKQTIYQTRGQSTTVKEKGHVNGYGWWFTGEIRGLVMDVEKESYFILPI